MNEFTVDSPPASDRGSEATYYLPITDHGLYDPTIYGLDKAIGNINESAFGYETERLWHHTETPDTMTAPTALDLTPVQDYLTAVSDALTELNTDLAGRVEEQLVERAVSKRYGLTGSGLEDGKAGVTALAPLVTAVSDATNESAVAAFNTMRGAIKVSREMIVDAVVHATGLDVSADAWDVGLTASVVGAPLGVSKYAAHAVGSFLWNKERAFDPEKIDAINALLSDGAGKVNAAMSANDDACAKLEAAAKDITFPSKVTGTTVNADDFKPTVPAATPAVTTPGDSSPLVGGGSPGSMGGGGGGDTSPPESLEDLFNEPEPEMPPSMSDPGMGGSPLGGGGSPMDSGMGSGSPLGGAGSDPFGSEPLAALTDEEPVEEEEPLEDVSKEDEDTEDDELFPEDDEPGDEDEPVEEGTEEDEPVEEEVTEEETPGEELPTEGDPAAPADDTAARTVDIGNGRQITFPNASIADAVQRLVDSTGSGGGKTLYMALSEAGFNLPPMGQDIGELVPPALLSEGDIVKTEGMMGVFVGAGDVLMENGEVKALTDVTAEPGFGGLFRPEEPAPSSDGLSGPAQPVPAGDGSTSPLGAPTDPNGTSTVDPASASTSTPGDATAQAGTPGVPTDTAADDLAATDTLAGVGMGETDNGAGGLDPSTAFPS